MDLQKAKDDIRNRKRKEINLDELTEREVEILAEQIGQKIGNEVNQLSDKIRAMLKIYNLDIKFHYVLHQIGEEPKPSQNPPEAKLNKKRGRPKK